MKKAILILATALISLGGSSQDYYHGAGAQIYVGLFSEALPVPGIFYKATLDFDEVFAISSYPFIGLQFQTDQSGGAGYIGAGVPVLIEKYFGDVEMYVFM